MPVEIPLRSDLPYFGMQVVLDGTIYQLDFRWNVRATRDIDGKQGAWFMQIKDQSQQKIYAAGVKLTCAYPLLDNVADKPFPGIFLVYDTSGQQLDPGLNDLGDRISLWYWSPTEFSS